MKNLNLEMIDKEEGKFIKIRNERLRILDLTNYPFTKKNFELNDLNMVKRKIIIDINATDVKRRINELHSKKELKNEFSKFSLFVDVTLKNKPGPDKIKTIAVVNINNMKINYY